jgi:hypothetical protein
MTYKARTIWTVVLSVIATCCLLIVCLVPAYRYGFNIFRLLCGTAWLGIAFINGIIDRK